MSVLIFDTETTDKDDDRQIIEAAYLVLRPAEDLLGDEKIPEQISVSESDRERFKPSKALGYGAMAVHHILPEDLASCAPSASFTLPAGVEYLVGHSIDFDWQAIGSPKVKRICTHAMAQHIWPEADSHSQSALLYLLNGPNDNTRRQLKHAHGALVDVENNLALLEHILLAKLEIRTWSALWAFSEESRIPIYCPLKRWGDQKLSEMDDGAIGWCLRQDFIDDYFRKGLERVLEERYPPMPPPPPRQPPTEQREEETICDSDIPF